MKKLQLLLFVLSLPTILFAEYSISDFRDATDKITDSQERIALFRDYIIKAENMEVVRTAMDLWLGEQASSLRVFLDSMAQANPKSARYSYLLARIVEDPFERIRLGRKSVKLDPKFPYGYRVIAVTYRTYLFDEIEKNENTQKLKENLHLDASIFTKWTEIEPKEELAWQTRFEYLLYSENFNEAHQVLTKLDEFRLAKPNARKYSGDLVRLLTLEKRYDEAANHISAMLDESIERKMIEPSEKDKYGAITFVNVLHIAGHYEKMRDYLLSYPKLKENGILLSELAIAYLKLGNLDSMWVALDWYRNCPEANYPEMKEAEFWAQVNDTTRKEKYLADLKSDWDKRAGERREVVMKQLIEKDAPLWNLPDVNGDTVRLSDLRGKVVILDFWATWCGPCRMAMPVLDEFVRKNKNPNVKVFSVNVWERGKAKELIAKFMADNKYSMTLLYGTDDLAKEYGITGIPYICAIDKNGKIRFEELGFDTGLDEKLIWWVEALDK